MRSSSGARGVLIAGLGLMAACLALAAPEPAAPDRPEGVTALLARGRELYDAAHRERTEAAYQKAEDLFDEAVGRDPGSALALAWRGLARLSRAGAIAARSEFLRAGQVSGQGTADLDKAVTLSPGSAAVRQLRGLAYASMPSFLGHDATARADLEMVTASKEFEGMRGESRAHLLLQLGIVAEEMADPAAAGAAWRKAGEAAPGSEWGMDAAKRLDALAKPAPATDPQGRRRPDRFPEVRDDVSPIVVSASVTFPNHAGQWTRDQLPPMMRTFLDDLNKQPGLLGVHLLTSMDREGMLVMMTWWKDKRALNGWFYSDTHQGIIASIYNDPHRTEPVAAAPPAQRTGQVGIELFSVLPGRRILGAGGLTPEGALPPSITAEP